MNRESIPSTAPAAEERPAILPLKFWTRYKQSPDDPAKIEEEDWVEWVKKGEAGASGTTSEAIKRLAPRANPPRPAAVEWIVIGPAYEKWKKGEEIPVTGTPLYAWPGIPREMVDALKQYHVHSIEDLADMPDHQAAKIPLPRLREYRTRAKAYKEASGATDISDKLAVRDRRIQELAEQNKELAEQLRQFQARLAAIDGTGNVAAAPPAAGGEDDAQYVEVGPNDVPARPRRGRPPKARLDIAI